jgi:glycosyltransferase 2 family protein
VSQPAAEKPDPTLSPSTSRPNIWSIILPLAFGIAASAYLFYNHFDLQQFAAIRWDARACAWIFLAFIFLIIRHLAYMLRLRTLTGKIFSWRKTALFVTIWEFSAAIAPTSKGGPVAMFIILLREGVKAGRATASLLYIMLLDASFFVLSFPIWWLIFGDRVRMPTEAPDAIRHFANSAFYITFGIMIGLFLCLLTFLFIIPSTGQRIMHALSRLPWSTKRKAAIHQLGDDFVTSAAEIRAMPIGYHLRALVGTLGAWTSKFLMINCLVLAIMPSIPLDGSTQLFIYARLISMFIIMTFSPTPGGAGIAEIALAGFLSDLVPQSLGIIIALLWRLMAYYTYVLGGAVASGWYFSRPPSANIEKRVAQ